MYYIEGIVDGRWTTEAFSDDPRAFEFEDESLALAALIMLARYLEWEGRFRIVDDAGTVVAQGEIKEGGAIVTQG